MGCDIHIHVEVKVNGTWHHYSHPSIARNYSLFARMANVRNGGNIAPISEPRGLPPDVTFTTKIDCDHYGNDGHSHSWLSAKEVAALLEWQNSREIYSPAWSFATSLGCLFSGTWDWDLHPEDLDAYPPGFEDARLVFWFDS
jgi:hypothetical protein